MHFYVDEGLFDCDAAKEWTWILANEIHCWFTLLEGEITDNFTIQEVFGNWLMHLSKQVSMRAAGAGAAAVHTCGAWSCRRHMREGCSHRARRLSLDDVAASLKSAHGRPDPLFEMTTTAVHCYTPVSRYIICTYIDYLVYSRYSILSWELTVCVLLAP